MTQMPANKNNQSERSGRIGVFWFFQGRLLAASVTFEKGSDGPISIDSPFDHVSIWPQVQRADRRLLSLAYEEVPRGRVLFLKRKRQFVVYLDKVLATAPVRKAILKEFKLPARKTRFAQDRHYTTDPADLDRLLES